MKAAVDRARDARADVLVTLGGASVGDYDLVQKALVSSGMELGFWRIAMRPGKPLMHGRLGPMRILGLPGNPTSSMVCSILFLRPLLRALHGESDPGADPSQTARLAVDLPANGVRQDYMRASLIRRRRRNSRRDPGVSAGFVAGEDDGAGRRPYRAPAACRASEGRKSVSSDPVSWARGVGSSRPTSVKRDRLGGLTDLQGPREPLSAGLRGKKVNVVQRREPKNFGHIGQSVQSLEQVL